MMEKAVFDHKDTKSHSGNSGNKPKDFRNDQSSRPAPKFPDGELLDETTVLSPSTSIRGTIVTNGSLEVLGKIDGGVATLGKLTVKGAISGNSRASNIITEGAKVKGDLISSDAVLIGTGSIVEGNIAGSKAVIAGAVKGNMDIHGLVVLDATAIVLGDIKSESIQMLPGAAIEGNISQCYAERSPSSIFNDTVNGRQPDPVINDIPQTETETE